VVPFEPLSAAAVAVPGAETIGLLTLIAAVRTWARAVAVPEPLAVAGQLDLSGISPSPGRLRVRTWPLRGRTQSAFPAFPTTPGVMRAFSECLACGFVSSRS
jgi:hypothetical protein